MKAEAARARPEVVATVQQEAPAAVAIVQTVKTEIAAEPAPAVEQPAAPVTTAAEDVAPVAAVVRDELCAVVRRLVEDGAWPGVELPGAARAAEPALSRSGARMRTSPASSPSTPNARKPDFLVSSTRFSASERV